MQDRPTARVLVLGAILAVAQTFDATGVTGVVGYDLACLLAIGAAVAGLVRNRPADPGPWRLLLAGMVAFVVADLIWNGLLLADGAPEGASPLDVLYLAAYPLLAMGALRLARSRGLAVRREAALDALAALVPAAALTWVFVIEPALDKGLAPIDVASRAAYPLLDLVLLAAALWLGMGTIVTPAHRLLVAGLASTFVADVLYGILSVRGIDVAVDDAAWAMGYVLLGSAFLHPSMATLDRPSDDELAPRLSNRRFLLLGATPMVFPILRTARHWDDPVEVGLGIGAVIGMVLVLMRLVALLRDVDAARRTVAGTERRFRALVQNAAELLVVLDRDQRIVYTSPAIESVLGYPPDAVVGSHASDYLHPEDLDLVGGVLRSALRRPGGHGRAEFRARTREGSWRWLEASITNLLDDPDVGGIVVNERDVTAQRAAVDALRARAEQQGAVARIGQLALDGTPTDDLLDAAVGLIRRTMRVQSCQLFRRTTGDLVLEAAAGPPEPDVAVARLELGRGSQCGYTLEVGHPVVVADLPAETRFRRPGQRLDAAASSASVVVDGRDGPYGALIVHTLEPRAFSTEDVAFLQAAANALALVLERRAIEDQVAWRASHDPLTRLPNRSSFLERLDAALQRDAAGEVAVLFCDVDHFKVVNDGLGHDAGDRLLIAVANRLRAAVAPGDLVARFGGDEFVVLRDTVEWREEADALAADVLAAISTPIELGNEVLHLDASIGIAVGRRRQDTSATLLSDADAAMYRAKELGRGRAERFDHELRTRVVHRLHTEAALRRALEDGDLELHFQPVVELETGRAVAVEALVRWPRPDGTFLTPTSFVPLAEETGLIEDLGRWVLRDACRQLAAWGPAAGGLEVAVNVAPRQLLGGDLVHIVADACAGAGIEPSRLTLELTERALLVDAEAAVHAVQGLAELGVGLSIDDFGTGWSSLAYLKRLPVTELKVDRSFVAEVAAGGPDAAIVEATVRLGHTLALRTVAEGIECAEQAAILAALGCDRGQGYFLCPPLPPGELAIERLVRPGWVAVG